MKIGSAYDGVGDDQLTVDEMMNDPTLIPNRVVAAADGAWAEDLFLRQEASNQGPIEYHLARAETSTSEGVEEIPEFGEIPATLPQDEKRRKVAFPVKTGVALRISREMRLYNRRDAATIAQNDALKKMLRHGWETTEAALKGSGISELEVNTPWNEGATIPRDLVDAINAVQDARDPDTGGHFDYYADTILLNPTAATNIVTNEDMQRYYIGNMASESFVFKGLQTQALLGQLQVATSRMVPMGEAYVFERNAAGFKSDTAPLFASPLYAEHGGDEGTGGRTQAWRSDISRIRAVGIDNPQSVVRLTGLWGE